MEGAVPPHVSQPHKAYVWGHRGRKALNKREVKILGCSWPRDLGDRINKHSLQSLRKCHVCHRKCVDTRGQEYGEGGKLPLDVKKVMAS